MLQAAVAQQARHRLDVGAVVEDVDRERVARAVPGYMLLYARLCRPMPQSFQTHVVRRQGEYQRPALALAYQGQQSVVQRYHYPAGAAVPPGLGLLEPQHPVAVVDVGEGQRADVAPPQTRVEAENERPPYVRALAVIVRGDEPLHLFHTKDVFLERAVVDGNRHPLTRVLPQHLLLHRRL